MLRARLSDLKFSKAYNSWRQSEESDSTLALSLKKTAFPLCNLTYFISGDYPGVHWEEKLGSWECNILNKYSGIVLNIILKVQPRVELKHNTWIFMSVGIYSVGRLHHLFMLLYLLGFTKWYLRDIVCLHRKEMKGLDLSTRPALTRS